MGLSRRRVLWGLAAVAAAPLLPVLEHVAPRRVVEAVRSLAYPGRTRPLDLRRVREPSPWAG